jgi:maleylpyruvate isomerase
MAGLDTADPAGAAATLRKMADAATDLLLESAAGVSDEQAREPSLLPGWSRGHLLAHVGRNADSLRNLLVWARTGVETPQPAAGTARMEAIADVVVISGAM